MFRDAPLIGAGMGGYKRPSEQQSQTQSSHAHSVWMHELATVGIVGTALLGSLIGLTASRLVGTANGCWHSAGTLAVLVTWMVGGIFDAYQLNGHTLGLFTVVVTLALLPYRGHRIRVRP